MLENLTNSFSRVLDRFRGPGVLSEEDLQSALREARRALLEADVHFKVARGFTDRVSARLMGETKIAGVKGSEQALHAFQTELTAMMASEAPPIPSNPGHPMVLLLSGLQGAGKTTTAAKLGLWLRKRKHSKVLLAACDLQRPGAVDQLQTLGRQLDIEVYAEAVGEEGVTPEGVAARALEKAKTQRFDALIVDSAGRLHIDEDLMGELGRVHQAVSPDGTYLVLDAMTGQDAVESASAFSAQLDLHGLILTKMDGDARGGAALSIREVTGMPISFLGMGEKPNDLEEFDAERVARRILDLGDVVGLVDAAIEAVDEEKAAEDYSRMLEGQFTLVDLLDQFKMIQKMGSFKKVLGMMPGAGRMSGLLDSVDDGQFPRMEAIVLSMTMKERLHPELLDGSRRKRIARGCGQEVSDVNQLLRSFQQMQKQMKSMSKLMKGGRNKKRLLKQLGSSGGFPNLPGGFPRR